MQLGPTMMCKQLVTFDEVMTKHAVAAWKAQCRATVVGRSSCYFQTRCRLGMQRPAKHSMLPPEADTIVRTKHALI